MRQAKITRVLEDGSIEETFIDLPDKGSKSPNKKKTQVIKSSRKQSNGDNTKQEEEQATPISKASVEIK